jgi:uncharacterized protein (DUF4415 family)
MRDDDIDRSDLPEISPKRFAKALVRKGLKPVPQKVLLTLRIDSEVLAWFRERGRGYQTQMNTILKAYKEALEKHSV